LKAAFERNFQCEGALIGLCLCCVDKENLQQTVDAAKAAEAEKYDELITKLKDENESLIWVR